MYGGESTIYIYTSKPVLIAQKLEKERGIPHKRTRSTLLEQTKGNWLCKQNRSGFDV